MFATPSSPSIRPISDSSSRIEWISQLHVHKDPLVKRKTAIICTIGPKTNSVEMLQKLRSAGMNIVRMNFSHGSHEYHGSVITNVRECVKKYPEGRPLAIALDTKGAEIRTQKIKNDEELTIPAGHEMFLSVDDSRANDGGLDVVGVDYKKLPESTEVGRNIYIDDGQLRFEVIDVQKNGVKVRALNSWKLSNNKGVNLPMTTVDLPALSTRDKQDLQFGIEQGVDMIFASFIRKAEDIQEIRDVLNKTDSGKKIKIIAKIESHEGIENFDAILELTDGVMIARGDLGTEIPAEKVFIAQKMMIAKCNAAGKPVICATQMLESMTFNPRPTRAEVSDVANAVLDGADCVMLSGETAKGAYPLETVDMMHRLCREAEAVIFYPPLFNELRAVTSRPVSMTEAIASSAVNASMEQNAAAIIVLTTTGSSARLVAKYRPQVPIITVTRYAQVARQSHLYRGCYTLWYDKPSAPGAESTPSSPSKYDVWQEDVDARFSWAIEQGKKLGLLKDQDSVVGIQGWRGGSGNTSVMRMLTVGDLIMQK